MLLAPEAAEVDAAVERVFASDEYQTVLPADPVEAPASAPEPRPRQESRPPRDTDPVDTDGLRPMGSVLLWLFAGVLGIAVAVWLARELQGRQRARAAIAAAAARPEEPAPLAAAPRVADHQRLANEGRHAEAIHALLVAVLAAIGRAHAGMRPSWTSREILRLLKLEDGPERALRSLVGLVEVTRFGGAPAREEEYRRALTWRDATGFGGAP
jgi:hypothetical protein